MEVSIVEGSVVEGLALDHSHTSLEKVAPVAYGRVEHYWVCSSPYFDTSLIISPFSNRRESLTEEAADCSDIKADLIMYDCDGSMVNQVSLHFPSAEVRVFELGPFMAGCKLQAGLRHGHLEVRSSLEVRTWCRIQSRDSACMLGEGQFLTDVRRLCLAVVFSEERTSLVCVVNHNPFEASVRGKLFLGRRAPESAWKIPAFGSRLLSVACEFDDFIDIHGDEQLQGYLRLSVRGKDVVSVHLIEQSAGVRDSLMYASLS